MRGKTRTYIYIKEERERVYIMGGQTRESLSEREACVREREKQDKGDRCV